MADWLMGLIGLIGLIGLVGLIGLIGKPEPPRTFPANCLSLSPERADGTVYLAI